MINIRHQPDEALPDSRIATSPDPALGLVTGTVLLKEHDVGWADLYRAEEALLRKILGDILLDIQHVGSTCIPGLRAKPIIDILAGIEALAQGPALADSLRNAGYRYLGGHLVLGHHIFGKGVARTHLLHVVEYQGGAWRRVIAFRDILRKYPGIAARYEARKVQLSCQFRSDRAAYGEAKTPYIDSILAEYGDME